MISILNKLFTKLNSRKVIYDENFFQKNWFTSWDNLKETLSALIESQSHWKSILDFGCGPGIMIDFMSKKGYRYIGCDYSYEARTLYEKHYGENPSLYLSNLDVLPDGCEFDVFVAFDVFEHMTDDQIFNVLKKLHSIPQLFVNISRTRGIPGHINLKSDKEWIGFFDKIGYKFETQKTKEIRNLYKNISPNCLDLWNKNMFIFSKKEAV